MTIKRNGSKCVVGRFAPTPSGELHAGNLLCALISYLSAKSRGGKFIVRIEDLDVARCLPSVTDRILSQLDTFGLAGDEIQNQSERYDLYREKERELEAKGLTYPCFCTRSELHAAYAPRLNDGGILYSGKCKNLSNSQRETLLKTRTPCVRLCVPDEDVSFIDELKGECKQNLKRECGDFIIRRSDGIYAYQFAVAVDDGQDVSEVVRGDDLISSTPRQIYIMRLLGFEPPTYYHIPLLCDTDGRKLSKSEGDGLTRLLKKFPPDRIIGALAFAAGLTKSDEPAMPKDLISLFDFSLIKKTDYIAFTLQ